MNTDVHENEEEALASQQENEQSAYERLIEQQTEEREIMESRGQYQGGQGSISSGYYKQKHDDTLIKLLVSGFLLVLLIIGVLGALAYVYSKYRSKKEFKDPDVQSVTERPLQSLE